MLGYILRNYIAYLICSLSDFLKNTDGSGRHFEVPMSQNHEGLLQLNSLQPVTLVLALIRPTNLGRHHAR
jgi:hypothetical protein